MKISKAIRAAMAAFEKKGKGEIRNIYLEEGTGNNNNYKKLTIKIEYAIDGDYTESDSSPFHVCVQENDGKAVATVLENY